jgi:hypothetical protein
MFNENSKIRLFQQGIWALITASATPFCFCAMQKHLTI